MAHELDLDAGVFDAFQQRVNPVARAKKQRERLEGHAQSAQQTAARVFGLLPAGEEPKAVSPVVAAKKQFEGLSPDERRAALAALVDIAQEKGEMTSPAMVENGTLTEWELDEIDREVEEEYQEPGFQYDPYSGQPILDDELEDW